MHTYHILCDGSQYLVYSKLAAIQIEKYFPIDERDELRIYIHLANIKADRINACVDWLNECPCVVVTCDLINRNQRIPVVTHTFMRQGPRLLGSIAQLAMNNLTKEFSFEPYINLVDADCFLAGSEWFEKSAILRKQEPYVITSAYRGDYHTATFQGKKLRSYDTIIYSINTKIHNAIQFQIGDPVDIGAVTRIKKEFPQLVFESDFRCDRGVLESIKAQMYGFNVTDINELSTICHVGGVSHFKESYFEHDRERINMWIRRARLHMRVMSFFRILKWDSFLDKAHVEKLDKIFKYIQDKNKLKKVFDNLEPSPDEIIFEGISSLY